VVNIEFRTDVYYVDPVTGLYAENTALIKIDHSSAAYLTHSINRLSVLADMPIKTKQDICLALRLYGHCLLDVQREALEDYCG
jgi:hypothetical protein